MSRPSLWTLFALLVLGAPLAFADSLLNGLAIHKEFNKDQFIGALYTDTLSSDAATLLNSPGSKRLELRVVTKRLSSRSLNSMWIEGMAINNPPTLLTAQAEHMVTFSTFIKRSLRAGDVLTIRGDKGKTTVTLNDVQLGVVHSPNFFNMVLRTWIGSVPLSSDFRDSLLTSGKVDGELLAQLESISPSQSRTEAVAKWVLPADAATEAAAANDSQSPKDNHPANKPDAGITNPVIAAPSLAAPALIDKPTIAVAKPTTPAMTPEEASATAPEKAQASEQLPKKVANAPKEPAQSKPEPKSEPTLAVANASPQPALSEAALLEEEALFDDEEDERGPLLTAESLLSRQIYHSQLLKWTYKHIRYPKRAVSRGHEGSVRVAVVIDRQGKVKSVSEVESSKHDALNREALNAVDRAKPFPPMPETLQGSEFAFSLPIQFRLPD